MVPSARQPPNTANVFSTLWRRRSLWWYSFVRKLWEKCLRRHGRFIHANPRRLKWPNGSQTVMNWHARQWFKNLSISSELKGVANLLQMNIIKWGKEKDTKGRSFYGAPPSHRQATIAISCFVWNTYNDQLHRFGSQYFFLDLIFLPFQIIGAHKRFQFASFTPKAFHWMHLVSCPFVIYGS